MVVMLALWGCGSDGCLGGEDGCRVEPACTDLAFTCEDGAARVDRVERGEVDLTTNNAVMSVGDWILDNGRVRAVISDLDHPHFLAPTGGNLVDVATYGPDGIRQDDSLRNLYQVGGLLPTEAAAYTSIEAFMDGPNAVLQVIGTYDDDEEVRIATRYELGPCDDGIRVRTELVNLHDEPESVFLADAHYIGSRESLSFAPGIGMEHPSFGLSTLADGIREVDWVSSGAHEAPGETAISITSCTEESVQALMSEEITAVGLPPTLLGSGDYLVHERFIGIGHGGSVSAGSDIAMAVREQLHGETTAQVTVRLAEDDRPTTGRPHGFVVRGDVPLGETAPDHVTHLDLSTDVTFSVPAGGTYTLLVERFGLPWSRQVFDADAGEVVVDLPDSGQVQLDVTVDGANDHAMVSIWPADQETFDAVQADYLGHFKTCAPMLGHPFGGAPSCNRVLVDGPHTLDLPPGRYDFFSTLGPFSSLATARNVEVVAGQSVDVALDVRPLPVLGADRLTADFHVHGSASFDATIPDGDRVRAFLASRLDVIAATDHDKLHDYAATMDELQAHDRLELLLGLETTGHILQPLLESSDFPKVVGHWIAWPFQYDPTAPYRGAPWDEKAQPGELFTRFEDAGWPADTGVIQLNHPVGGIQFGRDFGWATALEMDASQPLTGDDVPEGHQLFAATPPGARFANDAYHLQEVMNGTDNAQFQQYRALWHYLLTEGHVRTGTANSDSHTLGGNVLGFPLNVVRSRERVGSFDQPTFNQQVREGRSYGTNGPALEVRILDGDRVHEPRVDAAIAVSGTLVVEVSSADWVPVTEVRFYADGELVETLPIDLIDDPARPGVRSATVERDVASLVQEGSDHWLTVEAGAPLPLVADLDCDGLPDTGDHNGDGVIDVRDVEEPDPDDDGPCLTATGPLELERPFGLPTSDFDAIVPGGYPLAFTNPFLFDGDASGAYEGRP